MKGKKREDGGGNKNTTKKPNNSIDNAISSKIGKTILFSWLTHIKMFIQV